MKETLAALMKRPAARTGLAAALMFQLIFCVIWMTGYDGVTDNVNQLKVAIVSEDGGMGPAIAEGLKQQLPFDIELTNSRAEAIEDLEERAVHMVVVIPESFTASVQTPGQSASMDYYINESNPQMIKSVMQGAAASITSAVNKQAVTANVQGILSGLQVPEQQAAGMVQGIAEKVTAHVQSLNPVKGMNNQMVPMMMVLASFVGAMIMQMNLSQAGGELVRMGDVSKGSLFAARTLLNVGAALVISAIGSALMLAFGGQHESGFVAIWLYQCLFLMTFMFFAQMFLMLLGPAGMLLNIISLSVQLVTSGAMVPRELLSDFYQGVGSVLPATYAVKGMMTLLYGGPSVLPSAGVLVLILTICLVIGGAASFLRKQPAQGRGTVEGAPSPIS